jgi:hypothetical protein
MRIIFGEALKERFFDGPKGVFIQTKNREFFWFPFRKTGAKWSAINWKRISNKTIPRIFANEITEKTKKQAKLAEKERRAFGKIISEGIPFLDWAIDDEERKELKEIMRIRSDGEWDKLHDIYKNHC